MKFLKNVNPLQLIDQFIYLSSNITSTENNVDKHIGKVVWLSWFGFYGISTIVGYLMPNPLYTYILNIYDLVGLGFMAYQPL